MTDQEWRQAADGQWYPVNGRKTKIPMWAGLVIAGAVWGLMIFAVVTGAGSDTPDTSDETRSTMNVVWAGMSTSERVAFCAEARAAGYHVVAAEVARGLDQREARWWLEDTCG